MSGREVGYRVERRYAARRRRSHPGHYCGAVTTFSMPVVPRYAEVDQQGVVFNGHYLTWFDEACTGFLDHLGVTYPGLIDTGHDIQVVHTDIDHLAGFRGRDSVRVVVQCDRTGAPGFTLGSTVLHRTEDPKEKFPAG